MNGDADRFACILEPTGNWTVWDCHNDEPATLDGEALIGRERHRAQAARDTLERIHQARLKRAASDAPSDSEDLSRDTRARGR